MMKKLKKIIEKNDGFLVVFGHDCDSVASGTIFVKLLKKLGKKVKFYVSSSNNGLEDVDEKRIKKCKFDNIIFLDLGSLDENIHKKIKKKIIIIDHHLPKKYKVECYINPRKTDRNAYVPVSYICWQIYSMFFDPNEINWIAGIGALGDHGVEGNEDLFIEIEKKWEIVGRKLESDYLFEKSKLGKITKIIDSARVVKGKVGATYAVKALLKARTFKDILKDKKLIKWYNTVKKELEKIEKDFEKNKKIFGNIIFYEIKSKLNLKSSFAGSLPKKYPKNIIVIAQKRGKIYDISFRRGDKTNVDLSKLVKKIEKNIKDSRGGGHPAASAIKVPSNKMKAFTEFLKLLKEK